MVVIDHVENNMKSRVVVNVPKGTDKPDKDEGKAEKAESNKK